jgi:hypothetical protein
VQGSAAAQGGRVGEESRGGRSSLRRCSSGQAHLQETLRNLLVGLTILSYRVYPYIKKGKKFRSPSQSK